MPDDPLDSALRLEVEAEVLRITRTLFTNDLEDVITKASRFQRDAGMPDDVPNPVNNQIRNAMNHLGRAIVSDTVGEAILNITNAKKHLYIAKCISLVSFIDVLQQNVEAAIYYIRYREKFVKTDYRERASDYMRHKRDIIGRIPSMSSRFSDAEVFELFPTKGIAKELEDITLAYLKLYREMTEEYRLPRPVWLRQGNRRRALFVATRTVFLQGLSVGVIVMAITAAGLVHFFQWLFVKIGLLQ